MTPTFFKSQAAFRRWLERHHTKSNELWVGFYRLETGRGGMTYPQALDEALSFGWIDGIRKKVDPDSYTVRFTPRKRGSRWSAVNIRRVAELKQAGRMAAAGLEVFDRRDRRKAGYSFEDRPEQLDPASEKQFRAARRAWAFFEAQPPGYRRTAIFWVLSAAREETRARRLAMLIADSAAGRRIGPLAREGQPERQSQKPKA